MRNSPWIAAALVALTALAVLVGGFLGRWGTFAELNENAESAFSLQRQVDELTLALEERQSELQMLRTRHEVDRRALELVRAEIAGHREREAELEEVLGFYQGLMAPGGEVGGLGLRQPEVVAGDKSGHFRFRVVVQQEAQRHELVTGKFTMEVVGELKGFEISYPLEEIVPDFSEESTLLNFRYFQTLEGKIVLPEGLQPKEIVVSVTGVKPRKVNLSESFPWRLQERFTYVGN